MSVDFRLYLITAREVATRPLPEAVRLALEGGVRAVQLREKDLPVRELLALSRELRALTAEFGARFFINDRIDVAMAVGADGVHLGGKSMPVWAARKVAGEDMLIGASAHTLEEAWQAETEGADFLTFGPVYFTPSKAPHGNPVGLAELGRVTGKIHIPVYGLGGIKEGNLPGIFQAGAYGIAMISGILAAGDIRHASAEMIRRIGEAVNR